VGKLEEFEDEKRAESDLRVILKSFDCLMAGLGASIFD
jgi:hypothetical protein